MLSDYITTVQKKVSGKMVGVCSVYMRNGAILLCPHDQEGRSRPFDHHKLLPFTGWWDKLCNMTSTYDDKRKRNWVLKRVCQILGIEGERFMELKKLAGKLCKRLCLGQKKYPSVLLALAKESEFQYAEKDARNCPAVLRAKLLHCIVWGELPPEKVKAFLWMGGMKTPVTVFEKPKGMTGNPKTLKEYRFAYNLYNLQQQAEGPFPGRAEDARRALLSYFPFLKENPPLPKHFWAELTDSFRLKAQMEEARIHVLGLTPSNIQGWSKRVHDLWNANQQRVYQLQQEINNSRILPGENLIPELEHERVKVGKDLIQAGQDCHHCVGSYVSYPEYVHYRRGTVVCQILLADKRITQCFDSCNQETEASEAYKSEIAHYLEG